MLTHPLSLCRVGSLCFISKTPHLPERMRGVLCSETDQERRRGSDIDMDIHVVFS